MKLIFLSLFFMKMFIIKKIFILINIMIPAILGVLSLIVLGKQKNYRKHLVSNKVFQYLTLLFILSFLSVSVGLFNGFSFINALSFSSKFLMIIFIFISSFYLGMYMNKKYFQITISIILYLHVCAGIIFYFLGYGEIIDDILRPIGLFEYPNHLANITSFSFFFFLIFYIETKKVFSFHIFGIIFSFLLIILSASLKNLLVLFPVLLMYFFLKKGFKGIIYFISLIVPLIILILILFPDLSVFQRLSELSLNSLEYEVKTGEKLESSFQWRMLHWSLLVKDWWSNYLYFGGGLGQSVNMNGLKMPNGDGFAPHSDIIRFIIEYGIVFATIFFFIMIKFYMLFKENMKTYNTPNYIFIFLIYINFILSGFGGNVFYTLAFIYLFWMYVGFFEGNKYYYFINNRKGKI
jgi:hypothetical protein